MVKSIVGCEHFQNAACAVISRGVLSRRWTALLRLLLIVLLPIAGMVAYVGFAKWPTGAAVGGAGTIVITTQPTTKPVLRIASYNINSAQQRGIDAIASELKTFDLVGLQEVRGSLTGESQAEQLGAIAGLNALFAPTERTMFHDSFGNAVLTRLPIESWQRIPLPGTQSSGHRNVLVLRTRLGDRPLTVMVTHIDRVIDRAEQLQFLWELFDRTAGPVVLMGDFNTRRDDPLLHRYRNGTTEALEAIGLLPENDRIDWIFTRGVRVLDAGVRDNGASDHPLVWAEMTTP